jgi:hypothetical protein
VSTWTFSAADRVLACPASVALPQVRREASEHAAHGTAVHAYLRDSVVDGCEAALRRVPLDAPHRSVCEALDVARIIDELIGEPGHEYWLEAELAVAYDTRAGRARKLGVDLGRRYPQLGDTEVAGSLDLVIELQTSDEIIVVDWKTGHNPPSAERSGQLLLAALACRDIYLASTVHVAIVHIDDNGRYTIDRAEYDDDALDDAAHDVRSAVRAMAAARLEVEAGRVPSVAMGPHCRYCPAMHACPGQGGIVRQLVASVDAPDADTIGERMAALSVASVGHAWARMEQARALLESIERALKARCGAEGELPLPDGRVVRAVEVSRESIDVEAAVPALAAHLGIGEDAVRAACTVSMTKTSAEALARAAGGKPSAAMVALRAAGAVKATTTTSYRVSKPKE